MEKERLIQGETNKFLPISSIGLYGDSIGRVTLYDSSHANESEAQRIWTVTQICSLAYGNEEAKNPEALYERMKSIKHESLWEFIRSNHVPSGRTIEASMRNSNYGGGLPFTDTYKEFQTVTCLNEDRKWHQSKIACFRIKVPIFVARQFMRHRSFSYLEMSRRYTKDAKIPFEFWFPQDFNTCIGSKDTFISSMFNQVLWAVTDAGYHTQVASRFLPQTTYTEFYIMGEVEGLANFFRLRLAKEAQAEIREVAEAMLKLLANHQPELHLKVQ